MPPLRHAPTHTQLVAPYPNHAIVPTVQLVQAQPILSVVPSAGEENQAPPTNQPAPKATAVRNQSKKQTTNTELAPANLPANYLDIPLEEIKGEVPIYENAATIRRKLNKLIETKTKIPGSTKTFNKTTLSKELCAVAVRHHAIKTHQGMEHTGPGVQTLTKFLKMTGGMGGADTKSYYYGNMLLEKLRIWNGEKKTAARIMAEAEFPIGRERSDPDHLYLTVMKGEAMPKYSELANFGRGEMDW